MTARGFPLIVVSVCFCVTFLSSLNLKDRKREKREQTLLLLRIFMFQFHVSIPVPLLTATCPNTCPNTCPISPTHLFGGEVVERVAGQQVHGLHAVVQLLAGNPSVGQQLGHRLQLINQSINQSIHFIN